jgi:hypothetical protein
MYVCNRNVVIWDLLYSPRDRISAAFKCHDGGGATSLCYVAPTNTLVTGGNKGHISMIALNIACHMHLNPLAFISISHLSHCWMHCVCYRYL